MQAVALAIAVTLMDLSSAGGPPGILSVREFGAVGDGATDDTAAFQAAVDRAAEFGGTVFIDPVEPGRGYVITRTVVLRRGVSLVGSLAGMPFIAWEGVPRAMQTGPVILARPAEDQYIAGQKKPLFHLMGGNTLRGLYILYDRQPWPSDKD
ncbi:MAG: glycoside hydrolase family 55 protein, partial [Armatimonadetes bacterium]|nr:glycoside hydrolase family 55 protein [Armatimonadota bacterium]